MADSTRTSIPIRGAYRSQAHLALWEVLEKAEIWEQVGVEMAQMAYYANPREAEAALFDGTIDFISGNHITPYQLLAEGKPIVSIASPENSARCAIVSTQSVSSIRELRGKRVADTALKGRDGGFRHSRGNHMMYLLRSGVGLDEVEWVDVENKAAQIEALRSGKADAAFTRADLESSKRVGLHSILLDPLPMISGPTLTTTLTTLQDKAGVGERLVKTLVLGIHFARKNREQTELILDQLNERTGRSDKYESVAKMPVRPYPDPQAVINVHELSCMKFPEAKQVSPLALWDLHYLRILDQSGFIDRLYGQER
jgi:NMT1/THI5 like protein